MDKRVVEINEESLKIRSKVDGSQKLLVLQPASFAKTRRPRRAERFARSWQRFLPMRVK